MSSACCLPYHLCAAARFASPSPCSRLLPLAVGGHRRIISAHRRRCAVLCEVAVEVNGAPSTEAGQDDAGPQPRVGSKVRVLGPLQVYHVPKTPDFELAGHEGVVKDVLTCWKGKPISANLPYKVQFDLELQGKQVKFFAHLKEDEFHVIG